MDILAYLTMFGAVVSTLVTAWWTVFTWKTNETEKRASAEHERKERRYREMIGAIRSFYAIPADSTAKTVFLAELNLCWLDCSDEVIKAAYAFLATVHDSQISTTEQKQKALGRLFVAMRNDLISRTPITTTELKAKDFIPLVST